MVVFAFDVIIITQKRKVFRDKVTIIDNSQNYFSPSAAPTWTVDFHSTFLNIATNAAGTKEKRYTGKVKA